ncbi:MAG: hypothetical protein RDU20_08030 [Desulfomonilaceae bacterium]|nr:hypothetical protein [Desulfomonilaceae bacterium]
MGRKIGSNVLNFGVGGYGTDQAYLRYKRNGSFGEHIVMLCILPENINRIVNIFRPFYNYHYDDPLRLTKPRFVLNGNGFRLIENPISRSTDLWKLHDRQFLEKLGEMDYWYRLDRDLPRLGPPYLLSFIAWRKPILEQLKLRLRCVTGIRFHARYPWSLFDEVEPFGILCHIVDNFVQTARDRGAEPIIVIMPQSDFVRELQECGINRAGKLVAYLEYRNYAFVDLVQAMAAIGPTRDQLDQWYDGHATPEGNRITADLMFRNLVRMKSLDSGRRGQRPTTVDSEH